jgi:hypothetical protein
VIRIRRYAATVSFVCFIYEYMCERVLLQTVRYSTSDEEFQAPISMVLCLNPPQLCIRTPGRDSHLPQPGNSLHIPFYVNFSAIQTAFSTAAAAELGAITLSMEAQRRRPRTPLTQEKFFIHLNAGSYHGHIGMHTDRSSTVLQ